MESKYKEGDVIVLKEDFFEDLKMRNDKIKRLQRIEKCNIDATGRTYYQSKELRAIYEEWIEGIFRETPFSEIMTIKDSGERRKFESGAVRDVQEGKGRCDLLPLEEVGLWIDKPELMLIERFIKERNSEWIRNAMDRFIKREESGFKGMKTEEVCIEVAKHYEAGAQKYDERNWEKGIPLHNYVDSGVRHFLKCMSGYKDEPHNRAFLWNMLGLLWTFENHPECDDLPNKEVEKCISQNRD